MKSVITDLLVRKWTEENAKELIDFTPFEDGKLRGDLIDDLGFYHVKDGMGVFRLHIPHDNSITITANSDITLSWNEAFTNAGKLLNAYCEHQVIAIGFGGGWGWDGMQFFAQTYPRMSRDINTDADVIRLVPRLCPYSNKTDWFNKVPWDI